MEEKTTHNTKGTKMKTTETKTFTTKQAAYKFAAEKQAEGRQVEKKACVRPMFIAGRYLPSYPCWEVIVK